MNCKNAYYREHGNKGYILVGDFSKFFENIPHDKLIRSLKRHIKDEKMMNLLEMIVRSFSDDGKGLGIGSQISQICGIYYPTPLDIYFTSVMGCGKYARHMDDFYTISNDKESALPESILDLFLQNTSKRYKT